MTARRFRCPFALQPVPILPPLDADSVIRWSDVEDAHRGWDSDPEREELIPPGDES